MKQSVPLLALSFGLASYCMLLLVSQEATLRSLAIMGAISIFIISISMGIIWQLLLRPLERQPAPIVSAQIAENQNEQEYLVVSDEDIISR